MTRFRCEGPLTCSRVVRDDVVYSTPRGLAELVGRSDRLVWAEHEGQMDWCLCVIDLPATLTSARLNWRQGSDPKSLIVEP